MPDGMTIDANGDLWIANYNGAQVIFTYKQSTASTLKANVPNRCYT